LRTRTYHRYKHTAFHDVPLSCYIRRVKYTVFHQFDQHSGAVYGLAKGFRPSTFFSASGDHYVVEWNAEQRKQENFAIKSETPAYCLAAIESKKQLVFGTSSGSIHVIDADQRLELHHLSLHHNGVYSLVEWGEKLLACGGDGVLSVWNMADWTLFRSIPLCAEKIRSAAFSRDGQWLAVACGDGKLRVLETTFFNEIYTINGHDGGATSVAWHPNKTVLFSGGKDALIKTWNAASDFEPLVSLPAHNFAIYNIAFHPNKLIFATASRDKSIKIWDAQTLNAIQKLEAKSGGHSHSVNSLIWLGDFLISAGDDRRIVVWEEEKQYT
jgi:WD40 repeat protein